MMNILWIVNNILPDLAAATGLEMSPSGSWLIDLSKQLSENEDISLAIAAVGGDKFCSYTINGIKYYLLPGNGRNMLFYCRDYEQLWKKIAEEFKVDIVHLHGTEYSHGLSFLRVNPNVKAIVSVQGIISRIAEVYFDGLPKHFAFKYMTINEVTHLNSLFVKKKLYEFNSKYEREIFRRVKYANTVNFWDTSWASDINPSIKCFHLEYNLRNSFYTAEKWRLENIDKHRIFTNPGGDPIKGLHMLCRAIQKVKVIYPDVQVCVPGRNIIDKATTGYDKYLRKLIYELDIQDNIVFLGFLSEKEMLDNMLDSSIVVIPSAIEGTSLILREAMYVGLPVVASFRGGMGDFITNRIDGLLYDYSETSYLARLIMLLFTDKELALSISRNGIVKAEEAHDRMKNYKACLDIYKAIYEDDIDE